MSNIDTTPETAAGEPRFPLTRTGSFFHFIVSGDVERSRRFYTEVLGPRRRCPDGWSESSSSASR